MIKVEGVTKKFKDTIIFTGIDVQFDDGKKIMIKGENGSGKSVFLKLLVGYSQPDTGRIQIDDVVLSKDQDFMPDCGVSINAPQFMGQWTGLYNLEYLAQIKGVASRDHLERLAEVFDMKEHLKKKYKTYSLGMRQKMRIIQAVMDEPKYLVLDEPFDSLDHKMRDEALKFLDTYMKEHPTGILLYTSHSEKDEEFADEIYEIQNHSLIRLR